MLVDLDTGTGDLHDNLPDECEAVYEALVLGTRDYIHKCGLPTCLIGLSGGIDSSLVAAIAVDAVGTENVTGVGMPGPYSSEHSVTDARDDGRATGHSVRAVPSTPLRHVSSKHWPGVRGPPAGCYGRKPAIAPARRHADGALEQIRRAGADHRQQERTGRRLLHVVRRHVRRTRRHQRRSQDSGLSLVARRKQTSQRRHSGERVHESRPPPSFAPTRKTPIRFRNTICSTAFCGDMSKMSKAPTQIAEPRLAPISPLVRDIVNKVDRNEYKQTAGRARPEGHNEGVRHRAAISRSRRDLRSKPEDSNETNSSRDSSRCAACSLAGFAAAPPKQQVGPDCRTAGFC